MEVKAIFEYALEHPEQHHREIQFNLERQDLAVVSASSVLRKLKKAGLVREHRWHKPPKKWQRPEATAPHQHWLVDITPIPVEERFW